jgi:flagellar protein FliO/FliZ
MTLIVAQVTAAQPVAGPDLVPPVARMAAGLLVVLAILALLAWVMRRSLNTRRRNGSMTVETGLSLGERRSIVVVTVENRRLLLGLAPGQVSLLTELQPASFSQAMATATEQEART